MRHKAEVAGSGKGRGRQNKDFCNFFSLNFWVFFFFQKKARKSSHFSIPNTATLDDYKAFASCSLLTSQQGWNRTMPTSDRTRMLRTEKKPCRSTLHKLGVILCVQVMCSFLSHTKCIRFFELWKSRLGLRVSKAPPTLLTSKSKINWPGFLPTPTYCHSLEEF